MGQETTAGARKRLVTFALLDEGVTDGHRFGINALASSCSSVWAGGTRELFTAGRDGTVRCWRDLAEDGGREDGAAPRLHYVVEEHTDWVNDLALVMDGDLASAVVSASSDRTIKLWRPHEDGGAPSRYYTLRQHTDFVKALGYARDARTLASAGCDRVIVVWDMHRLAPCSIIGSSATNSPAAHDDSIYALSTTPCGSLIASGAVDGSLMLWDPRSKSPAVGSLVGHTDVIRGTVLSPDGKTLLSCSSDQTVRLWSLAQRRVELELRPHSDSVFAILPTADFRAVCSASRDGTVAWSSLVANSPHNSAEHPISHLLCKADAAVQRLHRPVWSDETLFVATTDSTLNGWRMPRDVPVAATSANAHVSQGTARRAAAPTNAVPPANGSLRAESEAAPLLKSPFTRIAGSPAVRQLAVLPSKVQLLSEDTRGRVALWDIMRGRCVRHFPENTKYDEVLKDLSKMPHAHNASWFSASAQSGTIEITLDPSSAFNAESYASDLGLASDADDVRLNLGERLLRALFAKWRQSTTNAGNGVDGPSASAPPALSSLPELVFRPLEQTPVRISEDGHVVTRTVASRLSSIPPDVVPHWVAQAVMDGQYTSRESVKMSFYLQPHPKSGLPALPADSNKLSAAKVLKIAKVVQYVEDRLPNLHPLQVMCGSTPLPPTMTLSAVRAFVWKSSDEMVLFYARAPSPISN